MRNLTYAQLRDALNYCPETGAFSRRVLSSNRIKLGDPCGTLSRTHGYRFICIGGTQYRAHRLAWLYVHGRWPADQIDHVNGKRDDNRLCNLREATALTNHHNLKKFVTNTSGKVGASFHAKTGKWRARIHYLGRERHLGLFPTLEAASAAYESAATSMFGAFKRPITG